MYCSSLPLSSGLMSVVAVDTPEDVGLVPDQRGGTGGEVETAPYQSRGHALVPALPRSTSKCYLCVFVKCCLCVFVKCCLLYVCEVLFVCVCVCLCCVFVKCWVCKCQPSKASLCLALVFCRSKKSRRRHSPSPSPRRSRSRSKSRSKSRSLSPGKAV